MLNKQQIEKALHMLCSADEAKRVGWEVVGMRAALLSHAFPAHFVLRSRQDAQTALKMNDAEWAQFGNLILAFWQESEASGQLMIAPPKSAPRTRGRKVGVDSFSPSKFGEAFPLVVAPNGPVKVAELPGESATRTTQELFDVMWAAYPNKTNKNYAFNCFKRLNATPEDVRTIQDDLKLRVYTKKWSDKDASFIPNPSTYINNRVWNEPILLSQLELAASILPEQERRAIFSKSNREVESWLGSQKLLKKIPTQAELEAHLGLRRQRGGSVVDGDIIDVVIAETRPVGALPAVSPAQVADGGAALMLPAKQRERVLDPFEAEFMQAISTVQDPEKRSRLMSKDQKGKRDWLATWKTMRASSAGKPVASRAPRVVGDTSAIEAAPSRSMSPGPQSNGGTEMDDGRLPSVAKSEQLNATRHRPDLFNSETWF